MATIGSLRIGMYVGTAEFAAGLGKARGMLRSFTGGIAASTRGLGSFGAALGVGFGAMQSMRAAMSIEGQMVGLAKAANVSGAGLTALRDEFLGLGSSMKAVKTEQLIEFATIGARMGVAAPELSGFAVAMAKGAAAMDNVDPSVMAEAIGRMKKVWDLDMTRDPLKVISAIDKIQDTTPAAAQGLFEVADAFGASAKQAGFTLEQTLALATPLLTLGTESATVGTVLQRLSQSMIDVERRASFAETIGVSVEEFTRVMKADPLQALNAWLSVLGRLSPEAAQAAMSGVLGRETALLSAEIQKLASQAGFLPGYLADIREQFRTSAQAEMSFAMASDTTGASITQLQNKLTELSVGLNEKTLPAMVTATGLAHDLATGVSEAFSRLDGLTAGGAGGGFAAFFEDMGWGLRNMADIVEAWVTEATGWFATIPQNLGAVASWIGSSFLHAIHDALNAAGAVVFNFVKNVAGVTQALARFAFRDTFEGFDFEWTPLLTHFEPTAPPPPEWATNPMGEAVEEVWQRINDREAAREAGQGVGAGLAEGVAAAGLGPGVASEVATGAAEGLESGIEAGAKALGKSPILPGAGMAASLLAGSMLGGGLASAVSAALPTAAVGAAAEEIATGMDAARAAEAGPTGAMRTTAANLELGSREAYQAIAAFRAGGQGQDRLLSVNNRQLATQNAMLGEMRKLNAGQLDVEAI